MCSATGCSSSRCQVCCPSYSAWPGTPVRSLTVLSHVIVMVIILVIMAIIVIMMVMMHAVQRCDGISAVAE